MSGRTWANIRYSSGYQSRRTIFCCARRSSRTTEDSSSERIMRLVPVFTLETNNQTNNECLPKFVQTHNASSSIKTANGENHISTYRCLHPQSPRCSYSCTYASQMLSNGFIHGVSSQDVSDKQFFCLRRKTNNFHK